MQKWKDIAPNFTPNEVMSPDGLYAYEVKQVLLVDYRSLLFLQELRNRIGRIMVNQPERGLRLRGYRSYTENKSIPNSAEFSHHILGKAFDCTPLDVSMDVLVVNALEVGFTRCFIYHKKNFTHIDTANLDLFNFDHLVRNK